ncbi:TMEM175 family protein [Pseudolysinimonas sp.]|uniref:TMEM175 family protein n=1 Tax=Pseudolysinimonas sp. TaxID=2680009 RepID=UPI003F81E933
MADGATESTDSVGLDRILFFGDAVVAIAITLLALPLVDEALKVTTATEFFRDDRIRAELIAAGVSFWMIAASWRNNHALFRRATGWRPAVLNIALGWIAAIVALPIATALVVGPVSGASDRLSLVVYLGVFTLAAGLTRLQHEVLARAGLLAESPESRLERAAGWLPIALRVLITALAAMVPDVGLWWLLLLAPGPVVAEVIRRRAATRRMPAR